MATMTALNSLDLDSDPRSIVGIRESTRRASFVQTMARLAGYVATMASR
jgi:hypothetical protein